jgi:hypothetical protein
MQGDMSKVMRMIAPPMAVGALLMVSCDSNDSGRPVQQRPDSERGTIRQIAMP